MIIRNETRLIFVKATQTTLAENKINNIQLEKTSTPWKLINGEKNLEKNRQNSTRCAVTRPRGICKLWRAIFSKRFCIFDCFSADRIPQTIVGVFGFFFRRELASDSSFCRHEIAFPPCTFLSFERRIRYALVHFLLFAIFALYVCVEYIYSSDYEPKEFVWLFAREKPLFDYLRSFLESRVGFVRILILFSLKLHFSIIAIQCRSLPFSHTNFRHIFVS